MISPRRTRLLRVPTLRAMQRAIVALTPRGLAARDVAVIVPSKSAAQQLRRTLEDAAIVGGFDPAFVPPDLITRAELYQSIHQRLPGAPPLVDEFERELLMRLAAEHALTQGLRPPFRLRPGLLRAILQFYDELRRRGRTIDSLDRHVREPLEAGRDSDAGAARLLEQTEFLSAAFAAFEQRVANSGRIDEHALRALALSAPQVKVYRHVIIAVADQAADPRGLWPVDFDLLSRIPALEQIDLVATEALLAAGYHQRLHDALPGLAEEFVGESGDVPVLVAPEHPPGLEPRAYFVSRDREEELADAVRWVKQRAREAGGAEGALVLDRTAIVFQRPLPYLYLARPVFASARVPYQAVDALPLAGEPFAAAIDLAFAAAAEDASRTAIVDLLASPHWRFRDPSNPEYVISRDDVAALDRVLRESKYLGGWDRLTQLADSVETRTVGGRDAERWRRSLPALRSAAALAPALEAIGGGSTAAAQVSAMLDVIKTLEALPAPEHPQYERHMRARAAIVGALTALRDAHLQFDDRPRPLVELVATIRRWIEDQTFAPRTGESGVLLLDARAAEFAEVDAVRLVGVVELDWPERAMGNIFYPSSLLRDIGWAPEADRLSAARARFLDLLALAARETAVSAFTLEDDAVVAPSPFLEDVGDRSGVSRLPVSTDRVFSHEALSLAPVVAVACDAISGVAAEWLTVRLARSPHADLRYHGTIGSRQPEVYAVSKVERYLDCPFKYFAGHVLQLDEEREDESGLTPQERGQLLHGVFEAFFVEWRERGYRAVTTDNLDHAIALFAEVAERELLDLPEADRALERTYLLGSAASPGLAERAFTFEIDQGVEVLERLLEHTLEGPFEFDDGSGKRIVRIRGKADRIDLLADGTLRIVDYKLGRAPKSARALQLAIYGVCASQQLEGRHGRPWSLGRAGYLAFRERNPFVDLGGRAGNVAEALRDGQERFLGAVARIEDGEFPPSPDEAWTCTRCGYSHVCRKDYVGDE
jgi:hypothetical protein